MDLLLRWLLTFWTVLLIYLPKQADVYDIREHHVRISEIGTIEKETYAVLFYLPDCFSCRAVLDYILQSRVYLVIDLYYLNMGEEEYLSYRSEEKILSAPTLLSVSDAGCTRIEGLDAVHLYLEKMIDR